ncbi:MAG TPA: DedA family protein [Pyrinomonadaceae bacterium]|nr:DedA family protein [Pyrinomonadaceae bacterium]
MEQHYFYQIIEQYGIYAVFALCTVEGDITLLISGVMAHSRFFGEYSFFKVFLAGMTGGVAGDSFGYWVGRLFAKTISNYKFYQRSQPRIERLVNKFGGAAIIISKYIYGIRVAICISSGVGKMPFLRFLFNDAISCSVWALLLAGTGYFFSGAITNIIGDFPKIGIALLIIVIFGVVGLYILERFWLSKKIEEADPETIYKIEEKIHDIEDRLHIPHRHDEKVERELNRKDEV